MSFERKKIHTEILGEYLREIRISHRFSIEEVAAKIGIKPNFLDALEESNYKNLPPDVYVLGFLRQLAEAYAIDGGALIGQYKKEKTIQNQMHQLHKDKRWKERYFSNFTITPKVAGVFLGIAFAFLTVIYIIWQVASIDTAPNLEIHQPQDRQLIKGTSVIISGKTDPGMVVAVNGQDVFVDSNGNFRTQIGVEPGPKDLKITAKNKFDKITAKTIGVVSEEQDSIPHYPVDLRLEFSADVNISVSIDNGQAQKLSFHGGDVKSFSGQKQITVSTTDAGATKATLNGQYLGAMGRSGESLQNIPFFAGSDNPGTGQQE